jgi:hypothetical protein
MLRTRLVLACIDTRILCNGDVVGDLNNEAESFSIEAVDG